MRWEWRLERLLSRPAQNSIGISDCAERDEPGRARTSRGPDTWGVLEKRDIDGDGRKEDSSFGTDLIAAVPASVERQAVDLEAWPVACRGAQKADKDGSDHEYCGRHPCGLPDGVRVAKGADSYAEGDAGRNHDDGIHAPTGCQRLRPLRRSLRHARPGYQESLRQSQDGAAQVAANQKVGSEREGSRANDVCER